MTSFNIETLLEENALGRLSKRYITYSGTRIKNECITYSKTTVGGDCLKLSYVYKGSLLVGVHSSIDTWTQLMEDSTSGSSSTFIDAYALDFDGVNDYVDFGNSHNYDASQAFTISMWVNPQNVAAQRVLFAKATNDANVYGYILYHTSSGELFLQMRSAGALRQHTFTTKILDAGVYQHVVLTYSGSSNISGARAYINASVGDTPASGTLNSYLSGQSFQIASRNGNFNFSGHINEVTIWNKALNATEISELYNSGNPFDPNDHSASSFLKSWYRMGDGDIFPNIFDNVGTAAGVMINMSSEDIEEI